MKNVNIQGWVNTALLIIIAILLWKPAPVTTQEEKKDIQTHQRSIGQNFDVVASALNEAARLRTKVAKDSIRFSKALKALKIENSRLTENARKSRQAAQPAIDTIPEVDAAFDDQDALYANMKAQRDSLEEQLKVERMVSRDLLAVKDTETMAKDNIISHQQALIDIKDGQIKRLKRGRIWKPLVIIPAVAVGAYLIGAASD